MPELSEQAVRALLRDVMATADLENVTSKEVGGTGQGVLGIGGAGQGHPSPGAVPRCGRSWSGARGTAWPSTRISSTTRCCWCWRRWIGLPASSHTSSWCAAGRAGRVARVALSPPLTAVTTQGSEWNAANLEELQQNR